MRLLKRNPFAGDNSVADEVSAWFEANNGYSVIESLDFFADAVGTIDWYPASVTTEIDADGAATNDVDIAVDANDGIVGSGYVPTASDFLFVRDSNGNLNLRNIVSVGAATSGVRTITFGGAALSFSAGDDIHVVKAGDIRSRATADDEVVNDLRNAYVGFDQRPCYLVVSASGNNTMGGTEAIWSGLSG